MNRLLPWRDGEGPALWRHLRDGQARLLPRIGLSLASAAVLAMAAMLLLSVIEAGAGRVRDEHIAMTMGVAGATWCVVLGGIWWTYRRCQVLLKTLFALFAIWMITLPLTLLADSLGSGSDFLIPACILGGIAASFFVLTAVPYQHLHRRAQGRRLRGVDVACPSCGYSLVGLTECRCPECGEQFTIEQLLIEGGLVEGDDERRAPVVDAIVGVPRLDALPEAPA